jgi:hypothetical protein
MSNKQKKNLIIVNNFIKTNEDIDKIGKCLKKKYLNNKAYLKFLDKLMKNTIDTYSKIIINN